ncbi:hypothetical protein F5I97DRAFT_1844907 [Phlebopus sp. FC_14]|nr:hypothetical protein F5I97DRAFT_1844907 [Phlebopus sp. FC_14]
MNQGPPTPPPTSTTELRDEARDSAVSTSKTSSSFSQFPPAAVDSYQQAFPQIYEFAMRNDFSAVAQLAQIHDLNGTNDNSYTRLLLVVPLVLAYLVLDNLTLAQHVLMRLPESLLHLPISRALTNLLASASERNYANIFSRVQTLCILVEQPDFPDSALAKVVILMAAAFADSFRQRAFTLLSGAFASIKVSQAQMYLGSTREELLAASSTRWQYDAGTDTLHPIAVASSSGSTAPSLPSSLGTFQVVANGLAERGG